VRILLSKTSGGPESLVLEDVPEPEPGPGEVRIAVKAVGVNFPDVLVIQDLYQFKPPRPFAPGGELSGVIDAVGSGVTGLGVGDRVLCSASSGGMAEKIVITPDKCHRIADDMPFDEAAALMFTYGTSLYALRQRGVLRAGEQLLVLGAAGGVGIAAVEIGKAMGATVVAAASTDEKVAFARSCGADGGVVYPADLRDGDKDASRALADAFKAASGGDGFDVIYDGVGGPYSEPALRAIAWEGRLLVVGFPAGIARLPLNLTLLKSADIVGVFWGAAVARDPDGYAADVATLFEWYGEGKIKPRVSSRYPLERGGDAIRELQERRALGKVIVEID
jgi:NADPH2:quinone reductase